LHYSCWFSADILSVVGAVIVGYGASMLQQGLGSSFFSKMVCLFFLNKICNDKIT